MSQQKYSKAYEAYQQAVYRDGRNPTFWCSIGVLYYQINQYRDALDAYSRAIRLNPYISEVWYDLGTLYESCNNQTNDALDAYQRAADLDPQNHHIKDRLQLLRNSGQSTGMPNQHSAPVPQDVHPQQYQAAGVGAPPGPQWGAPAPGPAPRSVAQGLGGGPPGPAHDWGRGLAEIQHPQPQPQPPNPYDQRDSFRPPPPRQMSPRTEQLRYQEQHRHTPVRRPSPPSGVNQMPPGPYGSHQTLSQPPPLPPQQPPQNRATNASSSYGPGPGPMSLPSSAGHNAPGPMPPYGRGNSPPPEIRPITEARPPSPGPNYSHQPYQHHPNPSQPGGIAAGAPPPAAALAAAEEAAARDRDERPGTGFKRMIESDEDHKMVHKYPANGETRRQLDDQHHRRPSPPGRQPSPRGRPPSPLRQQPSPPRMMHRHSSSDVRRDEQRRADENYYPSEAAHHPPTLPSMHQQAPSSEHLQSIPESSREERKETYEAASRKMEVDEDYDDEGEDNKRGGASGGRNSPARGMMNGQPKQESST